LKAAATTQLYQRACALGDSNSRFRVVTRYFRGVGAPRTPSAEWLYGTGKLAQEVPASDEKARQYFDLGCSKVRQTPSLARATPSNAPLAAGDVQRVMPRLFVATTSYVR
jgi:TPR repeat protein